jgi:hypothetical protein
MKKLVLALLVFAFVCAPIAYANSVIPAVGIKLEGTATQQLGKISYDDNGNKFRFVTNVGTKEFTGQPVFYVVNATNDYSIAAYSSGSTETFAGIVYCADDGGSTVAYNQNCWVQIAGLASAYVSAAADSYGANVALNDVLSAEVIIAAPTAGNQALLHYRAANTSLAQTSGDAACIYPRATAAKTTGSSLVNVILRDSF